MTLPEKFHCILCSKDVGDSKLNMMDGGVCFTSKGNYGSQVIDRGLDNENSFIEIYICDVCLLMKRDYVREFKNESYINWDPKSPIIDVKKDVVIIQTDNEGFRISKIGSGYSSHDYSVNLLETLTKIGGCLDQTGVRKLYLKRYLGLMTNREGCHLISIIGPLCKTTEKPYDSLNHFSNLCRKCVEIADIADYRRDHRRRYFESFNDFIQMRKNRKILLKNSE